MEWWGWVLSYLGVGVVFVPLDAIFTYHTSDDRKRVHADPALELRRLKAEAQKSYQWAFLCIPLWPVWIVIASCVGIARALPRFSNWVARKDIAALEQEIAEKKAEQILKQHELSSKSSWTKEYED